MKMSLTPFAGKSSLQTYKELQCCMAGGQTLQVLYFMEIFVVAVLVENKTMAAIENPSGNSKYASGKRMTKKSTRVDLTPMVDLGFLLITFFVFTTTMSKATTMKVDMPYDKTITRDEVCNSCVLTALLCKNDVIKYYEGDFAMAEIKTSDYNSIRGILQVKKEKVKQVTGNADRFVLIIKPTDESSFKNFVDIIDEVTINAIKRYYIDVVTGAEKKKLAAKFFDKPL
jgi:biopolymer transport protein ExbD